VGMGAGGGRSWGTSELGYFHMKTCRTIKEALQCAERSDKFVVADPVIKLYTKRIAKILFSNMSCHDVYIRIL